MYACLHSVDRAIYSTALLRTKIPRPPSANPHKAAASAIAYEMNNPRRQDINSGPATSGEQKPRHSTSFEVIWVLVYFAKQMCRSAEVEICK